MIRGLSVDEAIKQLKFLQKKAATDVREVLIEAKEMALRDHNVEYPSNMWVGKGIFFIKTHILGIYFCNFYSLFYTLLKVICNGFLVTHIKKMYNFL